MKLLIVLALIGAAFAFPEDVQPIELGEALAPEYIDFGMAYIPESVAHEAGLDKSVDEPAPIHFVNENGDIQSYVEHSPVDVAEAPVDELSPVHFVNNDEVQPFVEEVPVDAPVESNPAIAPGELEAVQVVDLDDLPEHPSPFMYAIHVDEPVIVDAPEGDHFYPGKLYDDPTWR
ncbi:uncharacterized protein LOC115448519 [Manduca sexta]|uniref:Uncharacterized protein n=1 Tax=Manduca sexta TaxID=7130 RepID=A0A921ZHR9_MANSE|nr:uncharacterized protein LOC115448519 [Manduca sexta]KAG6457936.1 hypothetical protein O3G_MSEX010569 [Manduca sexta]